MDTLKRVEVLWLDAQDHPEKWADNDDVQTWAEKSCEISSLGYLVRQTDRYITLGADWDPDDKDWGRVTKIPMKMVKEIIELKPPESP